jgi:hypothetical protein
LFGLCRTSYFVLQGEIIALYVVGNDEIGSAEMGVGGVVEGELSDLSGVEVVS